MRRVVAGLALVALVGAGLLISPRGERGSSLPPEAVPRSRAFEICHGNDTIDIQPAGVPFRQLGCREVCPHDDWDRCAVDEETNDAHGRPLRRVAFTVDGMGGYLRWTRPLPGVPLRAGLLIHSGGPGTEFGDRDHGLWKDLQSDGVRILAIRWHPGVKDPLTENARGWLSKKDVAPQTLRESTARVASAIRAAHDHLVPDPAPFGLIGISNGGLATVGAVVWHDLDPIVDWHLISSGAIMWDQQARCSASAGIRPEHGLCENAPERDCRQDADCGGRLDRCAWPAEHDKLTHMTDYALTTGDDCARGAVNPMFDANSIGKTQADLTWDSPAEFIVTEGGDGSDDTFAGYTWHMGMLYRHLTITHPLGKRWVDLEGVNHALATVIPANQPELDCAIRRGLSLPPCSRGR